MESNNGTNGNTSSSLPLFLSGLGAGIALTLLFAPLSGNATRRLIGRRVREGEDWITEKTTVAQDYVVSRGEGLRDRVKEVAEVIGRG